MAGAPLSPRGRVPSGSIASPLKACTVSKGKVLLLYPNRAALGRWMDGSSHLCLILFLSRIPTLRQCRYPFLQVRNQTPLPSHPILSLLSSRRTCTQLVPDALIPKVCERNFVSGPGFILTCPWGKPSGWRGAAGTPFSLPPQVGACEALTPVFSGLYHFQLQGEMLNIKPVLIGSETASKKETLDRARLNFTLHHSSLFISLPPHSLHK